MVCRGDVPVLALVFVVVCNVRIFRGVVGKCGKTMAKLFLGVSSFPCIPIILPDFGPLHLQNVTVCQFARSDSYPRVPTPP